jgi:transcription termination/antitermination protein NusG
MVCPLIVNDVHMQESSQQLLPWYALKVRTGAETSTALGLSNRGFDLFVPLYRAQLRYSDRTKMVQRAAFPGYLFCRFDAKQKAPVLSSPGVLYTVSFSGATLPIPETDIDTIRKTLDAGAHPVDYLRVGQRVRIQQGALAGIEGLLTRYEGKDHLTVSVHLLQRSVSLRIDSRYVMPL